ncbi:MAG: OadG family protein [Chloroflexus sp.]|uniref:OadG family protein n=1 Tax=Chloroflexus sp. TaxID=1904827 RepID=UPI00404A7D0A
MIDPGANPLLTGLQIAITGMSIVFIVLIIVALVLGALNTTQRLFRSTTPDTITPPSIPERNPVAADQLDPQLIAILTAAAVTALDRPVRILRVRYYRQLSVNWARLGRISVMANRQLRR